MLSWLISSRFATSLRHDGFARFTSIASMMAIGLGCFALVLSISILTGYEERILDTATAYTSHIEIRSREAGGLNLTRDHIAEIQSLQDVKSVDEVHICEALVRTKAGVDGVVLYGMSSQRLQHTLGTAMTSGTLPHKQGCVLGEEVARKLNVTPGDTVLFFATTVDRTRPLMFTSPVSGIASTGMQTVDASLVAMQTARLTAYTEQDMQHPSMLAIELHDPERAQRVAIRLLTMLPADCLIITWKDRFASIANWIALQRQPIPIVLGLISIVAGFTLLSTLLVAVVLKTKSLAILASLGMRKRGLYAIVLLRGLRLAITGAVSGTALAGILVVIQHQWNVIHLDGAIYYVSSLPVSLNPLPFVLVPGLCIVISIIASIVPMYVVGRLQLATALRWA